MLSDRRTIIILMISTCEGRDGNAEKSVQPMSDLF